MWWVGFVAFCSRPLRGRAGVEDPGYRKPTHTFSLDAVLRNPRDTISESANQCESGGRFAQQFAKIFPGCGSFAVPEGGNEPGAGVSPVRVGRSGGDSEN